MNSIKTLLITSRPIFWFGPVFIYLAGVLSPSREWNLTSIFGLLFVTFPMGLIVYGLNDIADRESDSINPRKGGTEGGVFKNSQLKLTFISIIVSTLLFLGFPITCLYTFRFDFDFLITLLRY